MAALPRMDHFFARLSDTLRASGLDCRYIMPSMQGDLLLSCNIEGNEARFVWRSSETAADAQSAGVLMGRPFIFPDGFGLKARLEFLHRLAAALSNAGAETLQALDRRNRDIYDIPRCAEGLRQVAAQHLQTGRPFWGEYILSSLEDRGENFFVFRFSSEQHGVALAFIADVHQAPQAELLLDTPLGTFFIYEDRRPADERARLSQQPERAFAWLMATGIHAGMRWTEPLPPLDIEDDGTQPGPGESRQEAEQPPQSFSDRLFQSWDLWAGRQDDFFANWGNDDLFYLSLLHSPGVAHIAHGGRECPAGTPPFFDPLERRTPSPFRLAMHPGIIKNFSFSDVDDKSTIFGGEARLREMLDQHIDSDEQLLLVTHHCEYLYTGDRAREICEKHPLSCAGRMRYLLPPMPQFVRAARELNWWDGIVARIPQLADRQTRAVNLIGISADGDDCGMELANCLKQIGIEVNSFFYPTLDITKLESFDRAGINVMRPWAPVRRVIGELLESRGFRLIDPPAPYGITGTARWIKAIAEALDIESGPIGRIDEIAESKRRKLEPLLEAAAGYKLAFVMRGEFIKDLTQPEFFFGLDPLALLHEFGFRTEIFSIGTAAGAAGLKLPSSATLTELDTESDIVEVLKSSDCRLVYSDRQHNTLLTAAGKTAFDIGDILPGFDGAGKTLRLLLTKARMDFYGRYGKYLTRPDHE